MSTLLIMNTIVLAFLFVIWSKSSMLNISIKFVLFGLLLGNLIQTLISFGIVITV